MSNFSIEKSLEVLERAPGILRALLERVSDEWIYETEGGDTWSAFDVVGHLVHGELTDWVVRMQIILSDKEDKMFEPFDRFAQVKESRGKTIVMLLDEFSELRAINLDTVRAFNLKNDDLGLLGTHPEFGKVSLKQLLATWVVHDLNHISQICRVLAGHYRDEVGPWAKYLRILR